MWIAPVDDQREAYLASFRVSPELVNEIVFLNVGLKFIKPFLIIVLFYKKC
jgi:hypothetical protein